MGISNVNNLNKIDITKLGLLSKSKSTQSSKPEYMKMTGSIFNAPQVKQQSKTTTLSTLNTDRSLSELSSKRKTSSTTTSSSGSSSSSSKSEESNEAKKEAVQKQGEQVKSYTKTVERDGQTVKKLQTEGKDLNKSIKNEEQKYQAQAKREQESFKKDNEKLNKITKETIEAQTIIDNAQNELDSLLGSSSFSVSGNKGGQSSNSNQDRINQLQQTIGTKSKLVQSNGKQIYSLRRSSSRSLTRMNKANSNFIKTNRRHSKTIQNNQTETNKTINVATKIEQISALTEQGGKMLDLLGQALMAAGAAIPGGFGAGLIATGQVMSKIGTTVEMVGQYGQLAANATKTIAYAAEGDLMGAMQSSAAAMQTGAAAVNSTKTLKSTFGSIDQQAQDATKKAAAR